MRQTIGGGARINDLMRMGVKRVGGEIRGQNAALAVDDISAGGVDRAGDLGHRRLGCLGGGKRRHPRADRAEGEHKHHRHQKHPPLGALAQAVARRLVALTQVFALDQGGVFTALAGVKDPR